MYLKQLIASNKTIFSLEDLGKIWRIENRDYLKLVASRLFKRGEIIRISRGIYAMNQEFNQYELANKLKPPSYVSLESVLQKEGVIFQDYSNTVFSVSNNSLSKKIGAKTFRYSKFSEKLLTNPLGITDLGQAKIATVERALCDRIYLSADYYFDNLRGINLEKLKAVAGIYNLRVRKEVAEIINGIKNK
jgi:predicted transcriptional regulator of viral defense system